MRHQVQPRSFYLMHTADPATGRLEVTFEEKPDFGPGDEQFLDPSRPVQLRPLIASDRPKPGRHYRANSLLVARLPDGEAHCYVWVPPAMRNTRAGLAMAIRAYDKFDPEFTAHLRALAGFKPT